MQDQVAALLTNELMIKFFITILALAITLYIGALLQAFVKSIVAFRAVSGSFRISKGAVLRFGTATGTIDGMLIEMDRKRVEVEFDDTIQSIPTATFAGMSWNVVKPGKDTMAIMPNVGESSLDMPCSGPSGS